MRSPRTAVWLAALGAALTLAPPGAFPAPADRVRMELIVVFERESAEAALLAQAVAVPEVRARLLERLRSMSGAPLRFEQFVSGGGVLVGVETEAVVRSVASHLEARQEVSSVRVDAPASSETPLYTAPARLMVRFPPGAADAPVPRPRLGCSGEGAASWVAERQRELGVPLVLEACENGELRLGIGWEQYSEVLKTRLQGQDAIDYVEVNRLLVPHGRF